jgi:hypothetical protein
MRRFANAFTADRGRCFRWVCESGVGRPVRCPGEVNTRGWWEDASGVWWVVDACAEHGGTLMPRRPAGGRAGRHGSGSARFRGEPRPDRPGTRRIEDVAGLLDDELRRVA